MGEFVSLDEETFDAIFQLIPSTLDGDLNWTRDQIFEYGIPDDRVWTIVEGDDGGNGLWCIPGWHVVNFFGYAVSTVGWTDEFGIEGCYMEAEPACGGCGVHERDMSYDEWCGECGTCKEHCYGSHGCTSSLGSVTCALEQGHDGPHRSDDG